MTTWLKIPQHVIYRGKKWFVVSECSACMALSSPLNSLTPIKARLKRITLQPNVDTERHLLMDTLLMCVTVHILKPFGRWTESVGIGPPRLFHRFLLVRARFLWLNSPAVIKVGLTTIWAARGGELKRQLIRELYNVTLLTRGVSALHNAREGSVTLVASVFTYLWNPGKHNNAQNKPHCLSY